MLASSINASTRFAALVQYRGALLLAGAALASLPIYWRGFASLVTAWSTPEYSHGPIIPLISTFLFLRELRSVPPTDKPITDRWPGVFVTACGLAIGLLGNLARIPDIITYGFIVWVAGLVLTLFGLRRGMLFWPALLHLVFMLPLPQFVYWQVSTYLQTVSSQIGVQIIHLFNIPVFLDGNIIDLGVYKLQVAEACSGLRYLFPMLSFSYVFAVLYQGPAWHKAVLLLSAAPITVAMNSFRIGMIGVLVDNFGISHAEGFLHTFEGWIIFLACVAILFMLAMALQRLTPQPRPLPETLDVSFDVLRDQAARIRDVAPSAALVAAALVTVATASAWAFAPERAPVVVNRDPLVLFPSQIEAWRGSRYILEPQIERVLSADDYHAASYSAPDEANSVDLFVAFYRKQTEGSGIHSPEVCIPAGGWEVSRWEPRTVTLPNDEQVKLNRAIIQKGLKRQIVYFWFEQRGRRLTNDYLAKAYTVWDSIVRGRTDGALVRLITPVGPNETPLEADARLERFMGLAVPELAHYVPK